MNLTARLKSARTQNYVLNVSIDIPLKYKHTQRQFKNQKQQQLKSSYKFKKKYKLSITPLKQKRTLNTSNPHTIKDIISNQSMTLQKGTLANVINGLNKKNQGINKYKSCNISPNSKNKKKKNININNHKEKQLNLVEKYQQEEEDTIIKYTNSSIELRKDQQKNNTNININTEEIDWKEIRQYEMLATERKEHLTYLYLKQKILILASVKKIQRAWKNYRTKKLLRSYSTDIRLNITNKIFNKNGEGSSSQATKSLGYNLLLKKSNLNQKKSDQIDRSQQIYEQQVIKKTKIDCKFYKNNSNVETKLKRFQNEEIRKWEDLLHQIRDGKNIHNLLQNSCKRRAEIEEQLQSKIFQQKEQQQKLSSKSYQKQQQQQNKASQDGQNTNRRKQKITFFENQMLKIDNDLSIDSSDNEIQFSEDSMEDQENKKLRKKLQIFNKINLIEENCMDFPIVENKVNCEENKELKKILKKKNNYQFESSSIYQIIQQQPIIQTHGELQVQPKDKCNHHRQEQTIFFQKQEEFEQKYSKIFPKYDNQFKEEEQSLKKVQISHQKLYKPKFSLVQQSSLNFSKYYDLTILQRLQLCKIISDQLVYESLLQFSQSEIIVKRIRELYQQNINNNTVLLDIIREMAPQGICTNIQSIKDYLQNLVTYLIQYEKQHIVKILNTPSGPTALTMLKFLRNQNVQPELGNQYVMTISMFDAHWKNTRQRIYFDVKYNDPEIQTERVNYLLGLTKVYFRVIFDALNESLQSCRVYSPTGNPYIWNYVYPKFIHTIIFENAIRQSYQRIMKLSILFCGIYFENSQQIMGAQIIEQINEDRLHKLIQIELQQEQYRWSFLDDQDAEIKYQLSQLIQNTLLFQFINQFK